MDERDRAIRARPAAASSSISRTPRALSAASAASMSATRSADVMQAGRRASSRNFATGESGDERLDQLERRVARSRRTRSAMRRRRPRARSISRPKRVPEERERRRQVRDGDADVIETAFDRVIGRRGRHRASHASTMPSAAVYGSISRAAMRSSSASNSPGASTCARRAA